MYLRKRSIIQLYYILIPIFFLIFMVQITNSFADTETLITGRVVKYSNPNEGIPNIEVTARKAQTGEPTNAAKTDANGYYTVQVDALLTSTNAEADFYVCAYDPNHIYVHECYDGYYYGAIAAFGEEELGEEVTLIHVKLNHEYPDKDFQLQKGGGNILATLNIPDDRGYKLCLEGEINFNKKEMHKDFVIDLNDIPDPLNINNELSPFHTPLPSANYSAKIEDINLSIYHREISLQTTYYYQLNNYNYLLSQYWYKKDSMEEADPINVSFGQTESITFSSLPEAGMLYGIIKGPNMNEKISKSYTYSEVQGGKSFVSYYGATDPDTSQWTEVINIRHCLTNTAIEDIYLKIIPQDGQQVIETLIPSKILHDPNSAYHIAASEEYEFGYGGYAFKFLEPSGGYKIQLLRRVGDTEILNIYYDGPTAVTHDYEEAEIISLNSGEKVKKVDIKVPAKTNIYGTVVDPNNKLICATVTLMTNPSNKKICEVFFDPNRQENFSFEELIHGDFTVRIEMNDPEIDQEYKVERISVNNVELGQNRDLGTIQLESYESCSGNKTIQGRIFSEDNQNIGIENIVVRVINIDDLSRSDPCLEDITDPNGRYSIPNLPNSLYILYTAHDPNVVTEGYFNEMYKNVILYGGPDDEENVFFPEKNEITLMKANFDPSNIDPNIPATLIGFSEGQDVTEDVNINVGLSNHVYHFPKGLNIFSYPGTPPIRYAGTGKKIIPRFPHESYPKIMSYITNENKWEVAYRDPNDGKIKGDDFPIKAGQGYVLYLDEDAYPSLPPFTIVTPTFDMVQGLNFISLPDGFEKQYYSKNMLSDLGGEERKACSINNYNCQTGKWKSTTCLWGLPAGDNFKFERHQGYSVYMKSPNLWP